MSKPRSPIDDLVHKTSSWLKDSGPVPSIVISSRIRLARNLDKYPFAVRTDDESMSEVLNVVKNGAAASEILRKAYFIAMDSVGEIDRQFLVERHLVSREHMLHPDFRAVIVGSDESLSVMVNEEDHLRIQAMQSGLNLREAWAEINTLDDQLAEKLEFAFTTKWGYLTCCPTNTGTGMRASVMLHLPALVMQKQINKILHTITKLGLAARGLYGEGTEATGNFFQISNQVTLGRHEEELIENIERILGQVIEHEQTAREALKNQNRAQLEDRIWRAYGIMRHARTVSSAEALDLLSAIRLGVDMELMPDVDRTILNELFLFCQPAHLQKLEGATLTPKERDMKRADLIRQRIGKT